MNTSRALTVGMAAAVVAFFSLSELKADGSLRIETLRVSCGGGSSGGGEYLLIGTAGQSDAGVLSNGGYTLIGGFWGVAFEVVLPPPDSAFAAWMDALPPEHRPPKGLRGPADEPAGDGMSNLLKYALGLQSMTPSRKGSPRLVSVDGAGSGSSGGGYLAVELIRSRTAAVDLRLESSDDLGDWTDVAFLIESLEEIDGERERIRLATGISRDEHPQKFVRLHVDSR